jgi:hypothetical protein
MWKERFDRELIVNKLSFLYYSSPKRANRSFPIIEPIQKKWCSDDFKYLVIESGLVNVVSKQQDRGVAVYAETAKGIRSQ